MEEEIVQTQGKSLCVLSLGHSKTGIGQNESLTIFRGLEELIINQTTRFTGS